jgi:tetratricopeptide (TPR) repeat protein
MAFVSGRGSAVVVMLCLAAPAAALDATQDAPARSIYQQALDLQNRANDDAALSLLWEAATLAPRDAEIQNALGEALDRIGALDGALAAYRAALAARPDFPKAANNLILALAKAGRGEEAVERARARVAEKPGDAERQFTLALAQSEQDVSSAIESYQRTLALAPRHVLARYNLALTLSRVDRAGDAIDELRRAIQIESRPELHYALGVIYWHQGDLDRAAAALSEAIAANDRYAEAYYTLGAVLKAKREWKGAAAALERAIALRPAHAEAHSTLAQVLELAGNGAAAAVERDRAEQLRREKAREQEASALTAAGVEQFGHGELPAALATFRKATAVLNSYAPAFYQMGRTLDALGRGAEARAAFARAHELNPSLQTPRNLP